jgi:hypothetical protein
MAITLPSRFQNATTRTADMTQDMLDLFNLVSQINAGLSPSIVSNLDANDTTASTAIPTTPTVVTLPTIVSQNNISFDTSTGIVTFSQTGSYQIVLLLNVFDSVTTSIFYGAEIDTGSGFVAALNTGRQQNINVNINGQVVFTAVENFSAGTRARVYVWASNGTGTYQTTSLTSLPGGSIQVPAKRLLITGQSS